MRPGRRALLRGLLGLLGLPLLGFASRAWATRPQASFAAAGFDEAFAALPGEGAATLSPVIDIELPALAEDGSTVPLAVRVDLAGVRGLSVLGSRNPVPLIAHFELAPEVLPALQTRIKLAESSDVVVVAETAEGRLFNRRRIEVARGGCL